MHESNTKSMWKLGVKMRESIGKYRGKSIVSGRWLYGSLVNNLFFMSKNGKPCAYILDPNIYPDYDSWDDIGELAEECEVDPETVGEFTGLQDKNGIDIYEGHDLIHPSGEKGKVIYDQPGCQFRVKYNDGQTGHLGLQLGKKGLAAVVHDKENI